MRNLLARGVEAQIRADGDKTGEPAGPDVRAGIQVVRRQLRLREHVAEGVTQSAAAGVDVALTALGALADGEVRLRVYGWREHTRERHATGSEAGQAVGHGVMSTMNSLT